MVSRCGAGSACQQRALLVCFEATFFTLTQATCFTTTRRFTTTRHKRVCEGHIRGFLKEKGVGRAMLGGALNTNGQEVYYSSA